MKSSITILSVVLGISFLAYAGSKEHPAELRLLLSEVQPGALGTEQYCMLVFDDHSFHSERAHRKLGKDQERAVYEGKLSDNDWDALTAIIDAKQFRELKVPESAPTLVVNDPHPYTISVARRGGFQNMEFLTKASLKPYESELKPLLRWWSSSRSAHMSESEAPPDRRCALNDSTGVFSN